MKTTKNYLPSTGAIAAIGVFALFLSPRSDEILSVRKFFEVGEIFPRW